MTTQQNAEEERRLVNMTQKWIKNVGEPMLFAPIMMQQMATANDRPANGKKWASRATFRAGNNGTAVETTVADAVNHLRDSSMPPIGELKAEDVDIQWSAFRPGASPKDEEPELNEDEKYQKILNDVTSPITIFYSHGGFYYTGSPATSRNCTVTLSQLTGARCLVVDYRLAPQNPFPGAIVDLFLAYLTLLYPGEGDFHEPVHPDQIVFAGDSSGSNLLLSLLQVIQYVKAHKGGEMNFQGRVVQVPMPAGLAVMCGHADHTNSFPSHTRNFPFDIFNADVLPFLHSNFPDCDLWPTKPPRGDIYCETHYLAHPMVSVAIAPAWSQAKLPPMFFASGEEKLIDECYFIASRAREAGTVVQFSQYDRLPHIFPLLFPTLYQSKHMFQQWAKFIVECGDVERNKKLKNRNDRYMVAGKGLARVDLVLSEDKDVDNAKSRIMKQVAKRKPWTGPTETPKL